MPLPSGTAPGGGPEGGALKRKAWDSGTDSVLQSCGSVAGSPDEAGGPQSSPGRTQRPPRLVPTRSLRLPRAEHQGCPHLYQHPHHPQAPQTTHPPKPTVSTSTKSTGAGSAATTTNAQGAARPTQPGHKPPRRAHVKTAAMFFLVTVTFLASYVPTFLMIVGAVPVHPVLYYTYLIHSTANPLLYSAANNNFRTSARNLFRRCLCKTVEPNWCR